MHNHVYTYKDVVQQGQPSHRSMYLYLYMHTYISTYTCMYIQGHFSSKTNIHFKCSYEASSFDHLTIWDMYVHTRTFFQQDQHSLQMIIWGFLFFSLKVWPFETCMHTRTFFQQDHHSIEVNSISDYLRLPPCVCALCLGFPVA